jgi:lysophospholipase L1-like esterase
MNLMKKIFVAGAAFASLLSAPSVLADPVDLAFQKPFVSSDPNPNGWNTGLTDGSWETDAGKTYAEGGTDVFPKTATVDLGAPTQLGYVATGVPPYGSTKTVVVSLSTNGSTYTQIGSYVFSQNQAEYHLFSFAATTARYIRLTYLDRYTVSVGYPVEIVFTSEVAAYAPGPAPPPAYIGLEPADIAAPKRDGTGQIDASFLAAHNSFLQRIQSGPIGVLFVGDSITHRWADHMDIWQQYYSQYSPADFGIEGDRTQNVLWRFDNGELDGINPKAVVVLIGTNNLNYPSADVVKADTKIVSEIHRHLPNTTVILLGIFPRSASATDPIRAEITGINTELAKLDSGGKMRFLDFGSKFLDPNGNITRDMMPDGLHPATPGYQIWATSMQPLLTQVWQSIYRIFPGMTISLKAIGSNNKYVTAGTSPLIASATSVGNAQKYLVVDAGSGNFGLRAVANSMYVCAEGGGASSLIANRSAVGPWETFTEVDAGGGNTGLRAVVNNMYVCAENGGANPLIANRTVLGPWETFFLTSY